MAWIRGSLTATLPLMLLLWAALAGCAGTPPQDTLAALRETCLSAAYSETVCKDYIVQASASQQGAQARDTVDEMIRRRGESAFLAYLLGEIELRRGAPEAARPHYERGLLLADEAEDALGRQRCLNALGWLAASQGEVDQGRALLEQAIAAGQEAGASLAVAKTLSNLAYVERSTGRYAAALETLRQAIPILESEGNDDLLRRVLSNECELSRQVGNLRRARTQCQRAHALAERAEDPRGLATVSIVEGLISLDQGSYPSAEKSFIEAAGHAKRAELDELRAHALILSGVAQTRQGDPGRALATLRKLDPTTKEQRLRHRLYLGQASRKAGDLAGARAALDSAAQLAEELGAVEEAWEVDVERASLARAAADLPGAIRYAREAVFAVEGMRQAIPLDGERTRFLNARSDVYEILAASLLDAAGGRVTNAVFSVMESAHARALREALSAQGPKFAGNRASPSPPANQRGSSPSPTNQPGSSQLRSAQDQFAAERASRPSPANQPGSSPSPTNQPGSSQLRSAQDQFAAEQTSRPSPANQPGSSPSPTNQPGSSQDRSARGQFVVERASLSLSEAQARLRPDDLLLEYLLGEDASLLLAISRDAAQAFVLPPRREIEAQVQAYRAILLRPTRSVDARLDPEADFRRDAGRGHELFKTLLSPARDLLSGARQLIVVPDRHLHLLPFAALVTDPPEAERELRFLVDRWELRSLPAAAFLVSQPGAATRNDSGITLLIADDGAPAYDLAPLAFATAEASAIARAYDPRQVERVSDAAACESLLTGDTRPQHAILQVISHARQDPESGPQLILGPADDPLIVSAEDIATSSAAPPLVILSACETARGEVIGGEGILGFVRAFTLAGSEAVVASLWSVDDARAASFWGDAHSELATGEAVATALARTQRARKHPFEHPFYWAAFVTYGSLSRIAVEQGDKAKEPRLIRAQGNDPG